MDPASLASSPELAARLSEWVFGQSVAIVVLLLWVLSLLWLLVNSHRRNERLSDLLVESVELGWRERFKTSEDALHKLDSSGRHMLEQLTHLATKRGG